MRLLPALGKAQMTGGGCSMGSQTAAVPQSAIHTRCLNGMGDGQNPDAHN